MTQEFIVSTVSRELAGKREEHPHARKELVAALTLQAMASGRLYM